MKGIFTGLIVSLAAAGWVSAAEVDDFELKSAADLADLCASTGDIAAVHMCQGYMVGVNHMHQAVADSVGHGAYCLPTDGSVTRNTAQADFVAWLRANPGKGNMTARDGLLEWASTTYPCG